MLEALLGVALIFVAADQSAIVEDYPEGYIHYEHPTQPVAVRDRGAVVEKPVSKFKYQNVVRQRYDYSCGSAALTTVLNQYLGRQFGERQIMEGLLRFGETDKIVDRRGFSLLDMKRLSSALGHPSGGFRAELSDLKDIDHPAIVPLHYGGFKHFVVVKDYRNGHFFIADPALGNISFSAHKFKEVWDPNVLFIIFPEGFEPQPGLELKKWDLRLVTERTMRRLAFRQFPVFTATDRNRANEAASLQRVRTEDKEGDERVLNIPTRTYYK